MFLKEINNEYCLQKKYTAHILYIFIIQNIQYKIYTKSITENTVQTSVKKTTAFLV